MARKSLSAQVIEEVDRARGLLAPVQGIVDPMTSHMVGAVLTSLHRIETLCIAARQGAVNDGLANLSAPPDAGSMVQAAPSSPSRGGTHRSSRSKREA